MSRLTLRLPETLHQQLIQLAESEGVSLNQYIVYALTRQVPAYSAYSVQNIPESELEQQQQSFKALNQKLGQASPTEIEAILAKRDRVEPEAELSPDTIAQLQKRLRKQS